MLAPLLAGLVFGAMAGQGFSAISRINLQAVLAALQDPLSLFAQRSPGKRASGKLHPTKSIKGKPHERVLAAVRDRPAAPAADNPVFGPIGEVPGPSVTIPVIPPQYEMPPAGPLTTGLSPFLVPPIPFVPIDNPGPPITPPPGTPVPPPGTPAPPPGTPTPPPDTPTPPPGTPTPPPGTPTLPPDSPPGTVITVPEPASWTMMLLGVVAIGMARRRMRKPKPLRWRSHG